MCGAEIEYSSAYGNDGDLCQSCYLMLAEHANSEWDSWYGMAPHEHVPLVNQAGAKVGHITRLIDYSDKPQVDSWYEIEPGLWFYPDAEVEGAQGIWKNARPRGREMSDGRFIWQVPRNKSF